MISMRGPPIRLSRRAATCSSVRRTGLGGMEWASPMPAMPIAVGTQAGYSTCRCTPRPATSCARDSLNAATAALEAA